MNEKYRVVASGSRGRSVYARCATEAELNAWLDAKTKWIFNGTRRHQKRVVTSNYDEIDIYEPILSHDGSGERLMTKWVASDTHTATRLTPEGDE